MLKEQSCMFCSGEERLTTLGQFCLCTACRNQAWSHALAFAMRNTVRGSVYHAAFADLYARLTDETETKWEEEAYDATK